MNKTDWDYLTEIFEVAEKGEHTEFTFLHNRDELKGAKLCCKAIKCLLKVMYNMLKAADHAIIVEEENFSDTDKEDFAEFHRMLEITISFYRDELKIIKDIISEYKNYLFWNFWPAVICQIDRPVEHEVDWRTIKIKWPWSKK